MNIKPLEHLIALAETGSFSRAAEQLHLTQSALSRSIQSLETELGGRLVDRVGKRNELTPLGHAVLERAQRIVHEAAELQRVAELQRQGEEGMLRVGMGSGPGERLMTPLLRHVAGLYPRVRVRISGGSVEVQLRQLRARELDALVIDARRVVPAPDLEVELLTELSAGFFCRAGHPLAALERVSFDKLLAYPIATTPLSDEVARLLVQRYGPRADPRQLVALSCEDVRSLIEALEGTDAIFLGILAAAREGVGQGRLVELPLSPRPAMGARYAYVRLAGRTEAPVMQVLRRFVDERLRD